ncbi:MAG: imidazole glycerol phosphate synthase subunit HisH [OM182 bacterium BACL3 MAG-120507-bin80]|jgi:imidazole glycerol-phosphate synthase subunit HisH|uniref:Imidazole glycerol phosphate synthase subunit HisH n=1 Tax=OM182 bacterium BACL3 MAG-120507-bin80 TaxID=1655577 RepID=A0A0R2SE81_9GAMM|nr:MAG: imidazole glycerol phosphate synthase subunit HisH [OM182 bacterium BACL3 MAG-120507-bin80]
MNKIAVIDYGMGNLHSVAKALEHVGAQLGQQIEVVVTPDPQLIAAADRVIFPGVGAIRDCMAEINRLEIGRIVRQAIETKPVFAICVGMQALMTRSEENGGVDCLGIVDGQVRYFGDALNGEAGQRLKVPHMGWNEVEQVGTHPLWQGIADRSRFYFVHSYYVPHDKDSLGRGVAGVARYGKDVAAVIARPNLFATQFHPEKSQEAGLSLLRNFLQWDGQA